MRALLLKPYAPPEVLDQGWNLGQCQVAVDGNIEAITPPSNAWHAFVNEDPGPRVYGNPLATALLRALGWNGLGPGVGLTGQVRGPVLFFGPVTDDGESTEVLPELVAVANALHVFTLAVGDAD